MFFRRKQHSVVRPSKVGRVASVLQVKKFSPGKLEKPRGGKGQTLAARGIGVSPQTGLVPRPEQSLSLMPKICEAGDLFLTKEEPHRIISIGFPFVSQGTEGEGLKHGNLGTELGCH